MTDSERTVVVGGLPYFGRKLAALLDGPGWRVRYLETRGWEPRAALATLREAASADLVYLVGGQVGWLSRPHLLKLLLRRPTVMHWAGTDVLHARRTVARGRGSLALMQGVTHWAGAPWLAEELREIGVSARWLPHSWVGQAYPPPLPDGPFTVLAYLPEQRARFYGSDAVLALAWALPSVRVLVVGAERLPGELPPNVTLLGWVDDIASVYRRCHALVRLPRHDGLAFMVQEALAFGRYVVWNHPFHNTIQASTTVAAIEAIWELMEWRRQGVLPVNEEGATQIRRRYTARRIRADLLKGFAGVLAG